MILTGYKKKIALILTTLLFVVGGASYAFAEDTSTTPAATASSTIPASPQTADPTGDQVRENLQCGFFGSETKIIDCIPVVIYYLVYKPANILLGISGVIFDYTLGLSIDTEFIDQPFIQTTWSIARDFANMAFIFILLYAGIMTMLGQADWRGVVLKVVIAALFINFSLFFTKIIIDAGNIFATGIYTAIGNPPTTPDGKRDVSGGLVAAFQPQSFITVTNKTNALEAIVVFIVAAVVNVAVAWAFFTIALVFIGRIVGFWVLMILSPIAFISTAFPNENHVWDNWLHNLVNQSFVAPIFLFFLYLILTVIQSNILQQAMNAGDDRGAITGLLFKPVVITIMLVYAIYKAKDFTEHMAGEFGSLGSKLGGTVMGVAGGAAFGAVGFTGRKVVGGVANKVFESGRMQGWATSNNALVRNIGMRGTLLADKGRNASFDARNVGFVASGIKQTGVDMGKAGGKGGYVKANKEFVEAEQKRAVLMELTDTEKARINEAAAAQAAALKKTVEGNVEATKKAAEEAQEAAKRAQEAHANSETAKALSDAMKNFQEAQERFNSGRGNPAEVKEAQEKLTSAMTNHQNAPTFEAAFTATEFLTKAKEKEKGALEAQKNLAKDQEKIIKGAEEQIKKVNEGVRQKYAESSGGWGGGGGAIYGIAMSKEEVKRMRKKIAKGPHKDDPYKELVKHAKEEAAKAAKESGGGEGGAKPAAKTEDHGGGDHH